MLAMSAAAAEPQYRLVLGSFEDEANAQHWAETVSRELAVDAEVVPFVDGDRHGFRVATGRLSADRLLAVSQRAQARGIASWRLLESPSTIAENPSPPAV